MFGANIISEIPPRGTKRKVHIARIGEMKNAFRERHRKTEIDFCVNWRIMLAWILQTGPWDMRVCTGLFSSERGVRARSFEHVSNTVNSSCK
jgi:hypothetical protein